MQFMFWIKCLKLKRSTNESKIGLGNFRKKIHCSIAFISTNSEFNRTRISILNENQNKVELKTLVRCISPRVNSRNAIRCKCTAQFVYLFVFSWLAKVCGFLWFVWNRRRTLISLHWLCFVCFRCPNQLNNRKAKCVNLEQTAKERTGESASCFCCRRRFAAKCGWTFLPSSCAKQMDGGKSCFSHDILMNAFLAPTQLVRTPRWSLSLQI